MIQSSLKRTRNQHKGIVEYSINVKGKPKCIGTYDENRKALYVVRTKSKHLHKNSDSYGFNHDMLEELFGICDVVIITEKDGKNIYVYTIPFFELMRNRFFLHFKKQGYERQVFIKHSIISNYKNN